VRDSIDEQVLDDLRVWAENSGRTGRVDLRRPRLAGESTKADSGCSARSGLTYHVPCERIQSL